MKFCQKCGNLLLVEKKGKSVYLFCRKCGKKYKVSSSEKKKLKVGEKFVKSKKDVFIMEKRDVESELPTTTIICPECGNKQAYWWVQETAGLTTESATQTVFYQCTKCKHKWRSYG